MATLRSGRLHPPRRRPVPARGAAAADDVAELVAADQHPQLDAPAVARRPKERAADGDRTRIAHRRHELIAHYLARANAPARVAGRGKAVRRAPARLPRFVGDIPPRLPARLAARAALVRAGNAAAEVRRTRSVRLPVEHVRVPVPVPQQAAVRAAVQAAAVLA
jgi:hypothetical protein